MNLSIATTAVATAFTIGLGCGTCCSPVISMFLSTYVVSRADGIKSGVLSFISFFTGKLLSVTFLCTIAAMIGREFISGDGYIGSFNLRFAAQIAMSLIGVAMTVKWVLEFKGKASCNGCHECSKSKEGVGWLPMLCAGLTYGFTPCAPLLIMIGYSFTLPIAFAFATGIAFGLSSMLSPILLLSVITGALSKKMAKEIPQHLKWFRLASGLLLIVMPFIIVR